MVFVFSFLMVFEVYWFLWEGSYGFFDGFLIDF